MRQLHNQTVRLREAFLRQDGRITGTIPKYMLASCLRAGGLELDQAQTNEACWKFMTGGMIADPDSASSQFYINVGSNPRLDSRPGQAGYTVFGRVVSGMDVVSAIENTPTQRRNGMANVPIEAVVIKSAKRL